MNKVIALLFILFLSASCIAEKIQIKPFDCGPLARGELGVVFSIGEHGSGQTYFTKGKAGDICPKLMSAKSVSGFESDYCVSYEPKNKKECSVIKVFTITSYQDVPNT